MPVAADFIPRVSASLCWAVLCIGLVAACAESTPGPGAGADVEVDYDSTEPGIAKLQFDDGTIVAETTVTGGFNDAGVHIAGEEAGVSFELSHPTPETDNATNGDPDFRLPFTLTLADGTELTAADAVFFRWTAFDRGYEGYAYLVEEPHNLTVVIGSDELITHSCTPMEGPICEEAATPHYRMDIDALTGWCVGTFTEAPCDRSNAVGECIWNYSTTVMDASICGAPNYPESLEDNCINNFEGDGEFVELNGGCP